MRILSDFSIGDIRLSDRCLGCERSPESEGTAGSPATPNQLATTPVASQRQVPRSDKKLGLINVFF
ncbi:MAG: hypothetical protein AAGA01_04385, partial [Cyanobacteria bacterium P01_E01_bin.43]